MTPATHHFQTRLMKTPSFSFSSCFFQKLLMTHATSIHVF
ncbi:hypothetical protein LCAZH_2863 [Lacticaseibacillus paracasei]|nr:hypothetical protein LCAZH_2863 [Lacticaseibacillus paracasei]OUC67258.1 hypothetical protein BWK52_3034 [Lacticaseibacillus paracasei]